MSGEFSCMANLVVCSCILNTFSLLLFICVAGHKGAMWHKDVNSGLSIMKNREAAWSCM